MILDFKEIPQANRGGGQQDAFELFARDFLFYLGYQIIEGPDRGADGKRDLIVAERVSGISTDITIKWLVSCKHYAHSGAAVKDSDEINIHERILQHKCDGFMGFYSTLPATSLSGLLEGVERTAIYDRERIEFLLLKDIEGQRLAARYFPITFRYYQIENPVPAKIFSDSKPICCEVCGQDLLSGEKSGIYITLKPHLEEDEDGNPKETDNQIKEIHFVCKGECDEQLKEQYRYEFMDSWGDIDDLRNPTLWIKLLFAFVNDIYNEQDLSKEAFETMKQMFIRSYPYIARHLTSKEKERVNDLLMAGII
ncbi:MAG: hypothetical protein J5382_05825 [Bacteroidales bacterium]|nr:hypothetical protein [Bacteroidales bacterium]